MILIDFSTKRQFTQLLLSFSPSQSLHHGTHTSRKLAASSTTSSSAETTSWKCSSLGTVGTGMKKKAESEKTVDPCLDNQKSWVWILWLSDERAGGPKLIQFLQLDVHAACHVQRDPWQGGSSDNQTRHEILSCIGTRSQAGHHSVTAYNQRNVPQHELFL